MPHRNLSLKECARYLGWNIREVEKLAQRGELPADKVRGEWRVNHIRLIEWVQQHLPSFDPERIRQIEQAAEARGEAEDMPAAGEGVYLTHLIRPELIEADLPAKTRRSVLEELVNLLERTDLLLDRRALLDSLLQREELCSTALPQGFALCHPRQPSPHFVEEPLVALARVSRGIAFGSPDGRLTRLFFLICCRDESHHLHTLARLVRFLDPESVQMLLSLPDAAAIHGFVQERDALLGQAGGT
ncbi:MAG: hypothetical protein EA425_12995 [Puniceicoccaceae bacterium]|nr:MAG: hypothetical protein EA425_12995 [Puniceicoccaceae bacterium]